MIEHTIDSDGLELFVVEAGPTDGETVVLVHGWPDSHRLWRHQIPALAEAGYRVFALDQRGFGRSERPADVGDYHAFNAMADLSNLLDAFGVGAAHLVGHDWGAPPCWLLATFAPDRVESLTVISVGHPTAFRNAGIPQRQRSFYMLLFQFVDIAERWLSDNDWANLRELVGPNNEWDNWMEYLSEPGALTASLNWYRCNLRPETLVDQPIELPNVTRPVMGVIGADDWALTREQMEGSAAHVDAEFRFELIESAAHWVPTDAPGELNRLLIDWIAQHP